jgi:hypothetical protein
MTHGVKPRFGLGGVIVEVVKRVRKEQNAFRLTNESFDLLFDMIEISAAINRGIADQQDSWR